LDTDRCAYGLKKDLRAVLAAMETRWSNGQIEGQINRLKAIKRQMYGRAGFHLLRARVLPYHTHGTINCTESAEDPFAAIHRLVGWRTNRAARVTASAHLFVAPPRIAIPSLE
jgi:hypothetical protein